MTGYVKVYKPELKIKEYEAYRGFYCSLCKTLGKEYGVFSRMLLSYDTTFLVIIMLSLYNIEPKMKKGRCPFDPTKRCLYCQNAADEFSYAAAVTVLMFYYKVKDNILDSSFFKKILMYLLLPYAYFLRKKAVRRFSRLDEIISSSMKKQAEVEKSSADSTDLAAHNSADALGKIFCREEENDLLYRFGYLVGRWVYLIDAADDIRKDIKSKSYNVFINKFGIECEDDINEAVKLSIQSTLNLCHASVIEALEKIDFCIFMPIINNVIYKSMENTTMNVLKGKQKDERSI